MKFKVFIISLLLLLSGCAPSPYLKQAIPPVDMPGIYHRVEKGQTLWRIAKTYNISLDYLVGINRIQDASNIEAGQLIFIPNQSKKLQVSSNISQGDFIWPLRGKVISTFGSNYANMINKGIHIQSYGNPKIVASRSGRVIFVSNNFGNYGKVVIIDHGDGFSTVYARNSEILAHPGDEVERGVVIAKAGGTSRDKNVYLHFQIRRGHTPQNPLFFLP